MQASVTVLIPSCNRPAALAVTLAGLCFQQFRGFTVAVSDQRDASVYEDASVRTAIRLLEKKGHTVRRLTNLPRAAWPSSGNSCSIRWNRLIVFTWMTMS